jgi:hypothetical protein
LEIGKRHELFRQPGTAPSNIGAPGATRRDRHNVRFVLGFGLVAIIIVFAIIWIVYFA